MFGEWLGGMLGEYVKLAGVGLLVTALVGLGKYLGWIPDGSAGKVEKGINLIFFGVFVVVVGLIGFAVPPWLDGFLGVVAQLLLALLGILVQHKSSGVGYEFAKAHNIPIAGYQHKGGGVG